MAQIAGAEVSSINLSNASDFCDTKRLWKKQSFGNSGTFRELTPNASTNLIQESSKLNRSLRHHKHQFSLIILNINDICIALMELRPIVELHTV